jgi:hypothetical protein
MTTMLRGLVGPPDQRQSNWQAWITENGSLLDRLRREQSDRLRALLPIIATTPELLGSLDPTERTAVRTATARENLRYQTIRSIIHQIGATLDRAGVRYAAFDGVALADAYWPQPRVRHSGGCRFVVPTGSVAAAVDAVLADASFTANSDPGHAMAATHQVITHQTELTIVVADHAADGWRSSVLGPSATSNENLSIPSPSDQFCATLGTAATYGNEASVIRVLDAAHIVHHSMVDWDLAVRRWHTHPAGRHIPHLLRYLATQLGVSGIPQRALDWGQHDYRRETRSDFESLVWAARHSGRWHPGRAIWGAPSSIARVRRTLWLAMGRIRAGSAASA